MWGRCMCMPGSLGRAVRCHILVDSVHHAIDVSKCLRFRCFDCAWIRRRTGLSCVVVATLGSEDAETQCIHVALLDVLATMFELTVRVVTKAFLQKRGALWHAFGNHFVEESTVIAFHAHALDPECTNSLQMRKVVKIR